MSLRDWLRNSWLAEHETSAEEIAALFAIVERDLANAKVATAALAAAGFRATRDQHHYRTIQSLALTIAWPAAKIDRFDRLRKKRNIGGYEIAGVVSSREAAEMHHLAASLRDDVLAWLRKNHPKLVRK